MQKKGKTINKLQELGRNVLNTIEQNKDFFLSKNRPRYCKVHI